MSDLRGLKRKLPELKSGPTKKLDFISRKNNYQNKDIGKDNKENKCDDRDRNREFDPLQVDNSRNSRNNSRKTDQSFTGADDS
eukprot:CAMPEP_0116946168 /NCGR_PEP_ID=MMETSP0467-20121206/36813_1 /TAXON_ID=283647 /ORGANISM="Mesodinium pulex, Strain SPMC105" /LENGTH=82 /DNA_ID=CAMNT_0004629871 /DNA_START=172 /DNA_END=420 /DNA_ORIENTATION=+